MGILVFLRVELGRWLNLTNGRGGECQFLINLIPRVKEQTLGGVGGYLLGILAKNETKEWILENKSKYREFE